MLSVFSPENRRFLPK
uniref:Uncharacterized protein n=1 Tax=Amphimedon queenslandica TaxID=400682 RepID=A0A1X7VRA7_AMPQE